MKSTIKVFRVLEVLCEGKAAGVTELSNQLDIKPSSMHRFLAVLTKLGYVRKNAATGKYFATLKIFQLGVSVRNKLSLISIARPYMEELGEMPETKDIPVIVVTGNRDLRARVKAKARIVEQMIQAPKAAWSMHL